MPTFIFSAILLLSLSLRTSVAQDPCGVAINNQDYCAVLDESCASEYLTPCSRARDAPNYCLKRNDQTGVNVWAECFQTKCALNYPPMNNDPATCTQLFTRERFLPNDANTDDSYGVNCWALAEWMYTCMGPTYTDQPESVFVFPQTTEDVISGFDCTRPSENQRNYPGLHYKRGPWEFWTDSPSGIIESRNCDELGKMQCLCTNNHIPDCFDRFTVYKNDLTFKNFCNVHQSPQCSAWTWMRCNTTKSRQISSVQLDQDPLYRQYCELLTDTERTQGLASFINNMNNCPCLEYRLDADAGHLIPTDPQAGECSSVVTLNAGETCLVNCRSGWRPNVAGLATRTLTCPTTTAPPEKVATLPLVCTPATCDSEPTFANIDPASVVSCPGTQTGQSCAFSCEPGYESVDSEILCTCTTENSASSDPIITCAWDDTVACTPTTTACDPNPCSNGGACSLNPFGPGFTCSCPPEYHGSTCANVYDDCADGVSDPSFKCGADAQNRPIGDCVDLVRTAADVANYTCNCYEGYTVDSGSVTSPPYFRSRCLANECSMGDVSVPFSNVDIVIAALPGPLVTHETMEVTCDEGYQGGGTYTCGTDGFVSGAACVARPCDAQTVPNSNYEQTPLDGNTGDSIVVDCNPGFVGGGTFECTASSTVWQGASCVEGDAACTALLDAEDYCGILENEETCFDSILSRCVDLGRNIGPRYAAEVCYKQNAQGVNVWAKCLSDKCLGSPGDTCNRQFARLEFQRFPPVSCWAVAESVNGCDVRSDTFYPMNAETFYRQTLLCADPSSIERGREYLPRIDNQNVREFWLDDAASSISPSTSQCDTLRDAQCDCANDHVATCFQLYETWLNGGQLQDDFCNIYANQYCVEWINMRCGTREQTREPSPDAYIDDFCGSVTSPTLVDTLNDCPCAPYALSTSEGYDVSSNPSPGFCGTTNEVQAGAKCEVRCLEGHRFSSLRLEDRELTCSAITRPPNKIATLNLICTPGTCDAAPTFANIDASSVASCASTVHEGTCDYACQSGYTSSSSQVRCVCQYFFDDTMNCQWTGGSSCDPISCADRLVSHSDYASTPLSGVFGQSVTVTCDPGYVGGGQYACGSDGTFTGVPCTYDDPCDPNPCLNGGTCTPFRRFANCACLPNYFGTRCGFAYDDCSDPSTCLNGTCTNLVRQLNRVANYSCACDPGFTEQQQYSDQQGYRSQCVANECASYDSVPHSDMQTVIAGLGSDRLTTGETIFVTCDPGYSGGGTFTCGTDGHVRGAPCDAESCAPLTIPASNHSNTPLVGVTGDTGYVACRIGYEGGGTFVCETNNVFSGVTCFPEDCSCQYLGTSASPCDSSSTTVYDEAGCNAIPAMFACVWQCGSCDLTLANIPNSNLSTWLASSPPSTTIAIGESIAVECDANFVGGGTFTCAGDGTIGGGTPCAREFCDVNQDVSNADPSFGDVVAAAQQVWGGPPRIGYTVNVTCAQGHVGGGIYTCTEQSGLFEGPSCDVEIDPCDPNPCANGGSCVRSGGGGRTCVCGPNFEGDSCEHAIVDCDVDICGNGTCIELERRVHGVANYTCACDPGYTTSSQTDPACSYEVPCPQPWTVGPSVPRGCACVEGYSGSVFATTSPPFYAGSCSPNPCNVSALDVPHSNAADMVASLQVPPVTGQTVEIRCDQGYSGGGLYTCETDGFIRGPSCDPVACFTMYVDYSNASYPAGNPLNGRTGDELFVQCNAGRIGGGVFRCESSGHFSGTSCFPDDCRCHYPNDYSTPCLPDGVVQGTLIDESACLSAAPSGTNTNCEWTCGSCNTSHQQIFNSNYDEPVLSTTGTRILYGDSVTVECDEGYSGGGDFVCERYCPPSTGGSSGGGGLSPGFGVISICPIMLHGEMCSPILCYASNQSAVNFSDFASVLESLHLPATVGDEVQVQCDEGYVGGGTYVCSSTGMFEGAPCEREEDPCTCVWIDPTTGRTISCGNNDHGYGSREECEMISIRPNPDSDEDYPCAWTCAEATTFAPDDQNAAIIPTGGPGSSGVDDDWLLKIPAYLTGAGLWGTLTLVLLTQAGLLAASSTTSLFDAHLTGAGSLAQACIAVVFTAQQINFRMRTRAVRESGQEDLRIFGSSFDFFSLGTESPLRAYEIEHEGGYWIFAANGTMMTSGRRALIGESSLVQYQFEPKSQLLDNIFWITLLFASIAFVRLASYAHHGDFDPCGGKSKISGEAIDVPSPPSTRPKRVAKEKRKRTRRSVVATKVDINRMLRTEVKKIEERDTTNTDRNVSVDIASSPSSMLPSSSSSTPFLCGVLDFAGKLFVFPRIELFVAIICTPALVQNAAATLGNMFDDFETPHLLLAGFALTCVATFVLCVFWALKRFIGVERRCAVVRGEWQNFNERHHAARSMAAASRSNLAFFESHHKISSLSLTSEIGGQDDSGVPEVNLVDVRVDTASKMRDAVDALHPTLSMISNNVPTPRQKDRLLGPKRRGFSFDVKDQSDFLIRFGNLGFVNFKEKMYGFAFVQLLYFVIFAFVVGFSGADDAAGKKGQIWLLLAIECVNGIMLGLFLPQLKWPNTICRCAMTLAGVISALEVVLKIFSCVLIFGLIEGSAVNDTIDGNDSMRLLIVTSCLLLLLKLIPLLTDHVIVPLIVALCCRKSALKSQIPVSNDKKGLVADIELTTKRRKPTDAAEVTIVLLENAGSLTQARLGTGDSYDAGESYDFNETLLEVLGDVDEEACEKEMLVKYVVLDKDLAFASSGDFHDVAWERKNHSYKGDDVNMYINKHTRRCTWTDPTSLRTLDWIELQIKFEDGRDRSYFVSTDATSVQRQVRDEKPESFDREAQRPTNAVAVRLHWENIDLYRVPKPFIDNLVSGAGSFMMRPGLSRVMNHPDATPRHVNATKSADDASDDGSRAQMLSAVFSHMKDAMAPRYKKVHLCYVGPKATESSVRAAFRKDASDEAKLNFRSANVAFDKSASKRTIMKSLKRCVLNEAGL